MSVFQHKWTRLISLILLLGIGQGVFAKGSAQATIPPAYEVLHAAKLIATARVDFPTYTLKSTNGYRVTAPNGTKFVVDDIVDPKCVFYGTYVSSNEDGYLGLSGGTPVTSNVYIGEVNFDGCQ